MAFNEVADRPRRRHEHNHGQNDSNGHDPDLCCEADSRDNRVDREHEIDHRDLDHDRGHLAIHLGRGLAFDALEIGMDLLHGLVDQEDATGDQDQILAREALAKGRKQWFGEAENPPNGKEQNQPRHQGQGHSELAGEWLLRGRQLADQERDDDQVIDAEHHLQGGQGEKAEPHLRVEQRVHCRDLLKFEGPQS